MTAKPAPDLESGLPFALPGREALGVDANATDTDDPLAIVDASPTGDAEVTRKQIPPPQASTGDDLALATEVAAAVETETDEDPEWALLARGPGAFPSGAADSDVSPKGDDDEGSPGSRRPAK